MGTDVGQAVELAADVEDSDLAPPDPHDSVAPLREVRDVADDVFSPRSQSA